MDENTVRNENDFLFDPRVENPDNSAQIIPITQAEPPMSHFNPEDASSVSRFFQMVADKIVLASTLPKEVEELRQMVTELRNDVEMLRRANEGLNEQVVSLRNERQALQDENASLRTELDSSQRRVSVLLSDLDVSNNNAERWHNDFIQASTDLASTKQLADDAQLKIMELEDIIVRMQRSIDGYRADAEEAQNRLSAIRGALAA